MWTTGAIVAVVLLVVAGILIGQLPKTYRLRGCQGKRWRERFPEADPGEIRRFLGLFTDGFAFSGKHKLRFHPDDSIIDVYRSLYSRWWSVSADAMELEDFAMRIRDGYGVDLTTVGYPDVTLGQVFQMVKRRPNQCTPQNA